MKQKALAQKRRKMLEDGGQDDKESKEKVRKKKGEYW